MNYTHAHSVLLHRLFQFLIPLRLLGLGLALLTSRPLAAATVLQGGGETFVAFEGEYPSAIIAGTPESWARVPDTEATGGAALEATGENATATSPHSFAQYQIKFSAAGSYYLYYRWRANPLRTAGDVFTANSSWLPITWGTPVTPGDQAPFYTSGSNAETAPADNTYAWRREAEDRVYAVSESELAAASPLTFTIGTREAGMLFDRFVLSTVPDLTPAALEALANSKTDVVTQDSGATFLAFQAEGQAKLIPGTPETWANVPDTEANSGGALEATGENLTGTSPHSFAQYQLKFGTAGIYYLYYRWRANPLRTAGDVFTANSSWLPLAFGPQSTPGDQTPFYTSGSNAETAPADNTYAWRREAEDRTYTVAEADLTGSNPLIFTIGTREAGMLFDRFVFSTDPALTPAQLDALADSGSKPVPPEVASAVGSAALNTVTLQFTRPLNPATVATGGFGFTPPLNVASAQVDAADARVVQLATAVQTAGTAYTIAISGVKDTSGTPVPAGTTAQFTAWKKVNGWVTTEIWFAIPGDTVQTLLDDPRYQAGNPNQTYYVKGFQLNQDPVGDNYGARLSGFFQPSATAAYDLFPNNDNEAELQLSSDTTTANLTSLGNFALSPPVFDPAFTATTPSLQAGQGYLLVGLLKQGGGDVYLNVAARRSGATTPAVADLPVLGGDNISTWINPDLGKITFQQQPTNLTAAAGSRARFTVKVEAKSSPVYYQWQVNGVDLPGAIRPTYVTPMLDSTSSGKKFRVVVSVAGVDTASDEATLTVTPGTPSNLQPIVGVNFVGGGGSSVGGALLPVDVAGVVPQENWNNLTGFTFDAAALHDATGASSPVTLTSTLNTETWYSGTRVVGDGDGQLFQGFIDAGASLEPVTFTLNQVPAGTYQVIAYSLGFDFSATYLQSYELTAAGVQPKYYGKSQTGLAYTQAPGFKRMDSTDPAVRPVGNYVLFDNVQPAPDGTLTLSVTWDSTETGNGHQPAVNAIQLVKVNPVVVPAAVSVRRSANGDVILVFTGRLQSARTLTGDFADVLGATSPYTIRSADAVGNQYFRSSN